MELKERLRELRGSTSQAECAKQLGFSAANYNKWENGVAPNYKILCKIADYYDVSLDYLVGRTEAKNVEYTNAVKESGLSEDALKTLCELREHAPEELQVLNYLLERDFRLSQTADTEDAALAEHLVIGEPPQSVDEEFPLLHLQGMRAVLKYILYNPESFVSYYRTACKYMPDNQGSPILTQQTMQSKLAEYYLEQSLNFEKFLYWTSTRRLERRKQHDEKT